MNIKHKVLLVTFPRSGHNLLEQCLRKVLGSKSFYYCEQYLACKTVPCSCKNAKAFQKTHDFNMNDKVSDGWKVLLQYRHPYESLTSYYQFELQQQYGRIRIDSYITWAEFLDKELLYWRKFMDKWWPVGGDVSLSSAGRKVPMMTLRYRDLVADLPGNVLAVLEFAGIANMADMEALRTLQAKARHPRDVREFRYYKKEDLEMVEKKCEIYLKRMNITSLLLHKG